MSSTPTRETIYIDAEDEITSVIDKIKHAKSKIVAVVLPKHTASLQSSVNLKLLKRASKNAAKNVVLITSDPLIMSMAGAAGVHVAKTLQSKPIVPEFSKTDREELTVGGDDYENDNEVDVTKSIGELAGEETIEVDDEVEQPKETAIEPKKKFTLKGRKFKIPNFEKFRLRLFLGVGALIALIIFWIFAATVLPSANIIITTDTSVLNSDLNLRARTDVNEADYAKMLVPAYAKEITKTESEKVPTSGERDEGKKATGTMTLKNCIFDGNSYTIPAGTGFSADGLTFVTDKAVTLDAATYMGPDNCISPTKNVGVTAIEGGEKYNVAAKSYTPPAAYNKASGSIQASGSAMSGGTTKLVKIVSQKDVDAAKQAILDKLQPKVEAEINEQFTTDQATAIKGTFKPNKPKVNSLPEVNKEASEVVVTVEVIYSQVGIKNEFLTKIIEEEAKKHIDNSKQTVQNTGLNNAKLTLLSTPSKSEFKLNLLTVVVAGPQLDSEGIKKEIAGQKKGRTKEIINARPGIQNVEIKYSPFWVASTPKKLNKINIVFKASDEQNTTN